MARRSRGNCGLQLRRLSSSSDHAQSSKSHLSRRGSCLRQGGLSLQVREFWFVSSSREACRSPILASSTYRSTGSYFLSSAFRSLAGRQLPVPPVWELKNPSTSRTLIGMALANAWKALEE